MDIMAVIEGIIRSLLMYTYSTCGLSSKVC